MTRSRLLIVVMLGFPLVLPACQRGGDGRDSMAAQQQPGRDSAAMAQVEREDGKVEVDWAAASDCPGKLRLLRVALAEGRITGLEGTPFALVSNDGWSARERWPTMGRLADGGGAIVSPEAAARCVIRLAPATDSRSDHQILDREQVHSEYRSGSRMEKNPAYEVAQARLRQAERAAKPVKSSVIKVGDPLIDLVGTLIGGALTGIGQWGAGDDLEAAIDQLAATPRSIEQPSFRTYQFERSRVRASREATVPIILTDRELQLSWRTRLRRREVREFSVLVGLDRQDRAYDDHRQTGITERDLRRWQTEIPTPPLEDIVASLLDNMSTAQAADRVVGAASDDAGRHVDAGIDAAVSMSSTGVDMERPDRQSKAAGIFSDDRSRIGVVQVSGAGQRGQGVYVGPRMVLTTSALVAGRSLVDVRTTTGQSVMGLVANVDRSRGLALVQVPRSGRPVTLFAGSITDSRDERRSDRSFGAQPVSFERRAGPTRRSTRPSGQDDVEGRPIFRGDSLIGLNSAGGEITVDTIHAFLAEQNSNLNDPGPSS